MPSTAARLSHLYQTRRHLPHNLTALITTFYIILYLISIHPLYNLYKHTYITKITMSASPQDPEVKAPEGMSVHDDIKPEDSKSTIGSSSQGGSSTVTDLEGFKHGKNKFGETREEETKRIAKHLSVIVDKAIERIEPFLEMIKTVLL